MESDHIGIMTPSQDLVTQPVVWNRCTPVSSCSFKDVMSETLALEMQQNEIENATALEISEPTTAGVFDGLFEIDTTSDLLLAQMLQSQFDSEHNYCQLKRVEEKLNGSNKVKITFDNYKTIRGDYSSDSDDNGQEVTDDTVHKDTKPQFNRSGFHGKGKQIVTKHDAAICGRMNALKIMENFPPEFETGNSEDFDISLPNVVFNQLLVHSKVDNKRSHRLHEKKEHSTTEQAVDAKTRLLLFQLVNSGILDAVNGPISCGKESVVCHANGGSMPNQIVPAECAVKIFKTTLSKFRNRCQYVRGDVRFFKDEFKKQNPRKLMKMWAEKEMINLKRMKKFSIPCPSVVLLKKHILVMTFIGNSQKPAPKLRDVHLSQAEWQLAYEQCVQHMRTLYKDCMLVHADLSEYNMLWWQDQIYIIDVAQAVDVMHPHAIQFLFRDCENVSEFFNKRGVVGVFDKFKLFSAVTDLDLAGKEQEYYSQIEQYEKDERFMQLEMGKTDFPFDYFFTRTCGEPAITTQGGDSSSSDSEIDVSNTDVVSRPIEGVLNENADGPDSGNLNVLPS